MSMPERPPRPETPSPNRPAASLGWPATTAVLAALAAGWIASSAAGLMAHPLRHVLTWLALALAVLADRPGGKRSLAQWLALAVGVVAAVGMTASSILAVNVLGASVLLAAAAVGRKGARASALLPAALAVGVLGLYRLALGIGTVWTVTDRIGGALGAIGGALTGRPLWVGATFGGLDFLIVMAVFLGGWVLLGRAPRRRDRWVPAGAILVVHVLYLAVLSFAPDLKAALPEADPEKGFTFANAAHAAIPWNLPAVGVLLHLLVAGLTLRWTPAPPSATAFADEPAPVDEPKEMLIRAVVLGGTVLLALLTPIAAALSTGSCDMQGKTVLANEEGFLNWLRPRHGQYGRLSIGMYGMMPDFFHSLGADFKKTVQLSQADIDDANLILSIYPNEVWRSGVEIVSVGDPAERVPDRWNPDKRIRVRKLKTDHGTVEVGERSQVLLYTPQPGYVGPDGFRYTIRVARDPNAPPPIGDPNDEFTAAVAVNVVAGEARPVVPAPGPMAAHALAEADTFNVPRDGKEFPLCVLNNDPGPPGQLARLRKYVRDGGALLVLGEHTVRDRNGVIHFNELLEGTDMAVRFDSATFGIGGWLHSYQTAWHPTTAGIDDERNRFGAVIGASVEARWPAVPLLIGRWGYADPGQMGGAGKMGNHEYDAGEKLGDLVLAAEQPCGKGRIVAFGDTSGFTNGITIGSHLYTSRLYGYLASQASSPQALWRQFLSILLAGGLIGLLIWRREPWQIAVAGIVTAWSLSFCTSLAYRAATVLPDGRGAQPNNLAYIDTTHMEAACAESWRPDGLAGLYLTLMRNGYLVLNLPEFTAERIEKAGLVISVAPAREFTAAERETIGNYVRNGGVFLCMVGHDRAGPSRSLLAELGFEVSEELNRPDEIRPRDPNRPRPRLPRGGPVEPQPMGHFKVPYLMSGNRQAFVRYHASWGIRSTAPKYDMLLERDFEAGPPPLGSKGAGSEGSDGVLLRTSDGGKGWCLRVARGYWQSPRVPVQAGRTYRCRFRSRSAAESRWEAFFVNAEGKRLKAFRASPLPAAEDWGKRDFTFPVQDPNARAMYLRISAGTSPLEIDDLRIQCQALRDIAFGRRLYLKEESEDDANTFWDTSPYANRVGRPNEIDPRWVALRDTPVIQYRWLGGGKDGKPAGKFVLIGDTGFAMNKNLERRDGQPIEGQRENADFWRWLLAELRGGKTWNPLAPPDPNAPGGAVGKGVTP